MLPTKAYATKSAESQLAPFQFERRDVQANDVLIEILYCGICHSDIHQARNEWGGSVYPMVPGHEIVGRVIKVGASVKNFNVGDMAGVGCFVDSCRTCDSCKKGLEQYCVSGMIQTYNSPEPGRKTPTYGGYSSQIVVDEKYTLQIPKNLELSGVAPLLCAGITTYSPLKHCEVKKSQAVAVMGLGGLGHMGVKLAAAFGAEVTVLSTSKSKEADAKRLGAANFVCTKDAGALEKLAEKFDVILNTVSAPFDLTPYLNALKTDGTLVLVGAPSQPHAVPAFPLIMRRRKILGSLIGGIKETQEMLDFCGQHNITADVEVIPATKINEAYERTLSAQVRYRFVIDMKTL